MPNKKLDRLAIILSGVLASIGILGLTGWSTGWRDLASINPAYIPISPDTSLAFLMLGLIVMYLIAQQGARAGNMLVSTILAVISLYGVLKFTENFLPLDLTLESILFPATEKVGPFVIKRMSPITGVLLFLSSAVLQLKMLYRNGPKTTHVISAVGVITFAAGFIAAVGYLYGTPLLYGGNVIPLAALTAIGFILLGCTLVLLAGRQSILLRPFLGTLAYARLLRVLLPLIVLAILLQGFADKLITQGLNINVVLVTALLSLFFAVLTGGVVFQLSRIIFRQADMAEIERIRSEEKNLQLAFIIEYSEDAIISKSLDGLILSWNTGAQRMYGYTKEEVLHRPISIIIPPDCQEEMTQILGQIRTGGHVDHYETRRQRKDGTQIVVSISISPLCDAEGKLLGASSIARDITEHKRAEEQLLIHSRAVEQSPASIVMTNTDGAIEYVNPKFVQLTGYSLEEVIGANPRILKSDEKPIEEYKQLWDLITSGNQWRGEFRNKKKNGELYWESAVISSIRNEQGKITHFLAVKEDITERKQAEEALHRSEEKFRAIFENNSSALALIEPDTTISMVNDAYCHMSGYTREEVIGMSWTQQIPPEDLERLKEYNRRRLLDPDDAPDKYEFKFYRKGGEIRFALMSVSMMRSTSKIITSFLDITERKKMEEALRASEDQIRLLLNSTAEAIYGIDLDGNCTFCNNSCIQKLGYQDASELIGKNMHWQIHSKRVDGTPYPVEECRIFAAFQKGENSHVEDEVLWRADGTSFPAEYWSYPEWRGGKMLGSVVTFFDITQRKQAEAEREKLIKELQFALDNVHTLQGLIPICANCKKIRDDTGYWQQVEGYIQSHSLAKFSHGICPDCAAIMYPDYLKNKPKRAEK